MLVVQRFRQSTHARDRDFGFLQQGDPLFTGEAPKARLNDVPQLWQTLFPESHRRAARIVDEFCNANRVAEALPPPLIHDRDKNIAILQSIEPVTSSRARLPTRTGRPCAAANSTGSMNISAASVSIIEASMCWPFRVRSLTLSAL